MNEEFKKIIKEIDYDHYFDDEAWFKEVLGADYECITKDGFGIIIEYRTKFGYKIGHSRGGIRFNRHKKTFKEYMAFIEFLKADLKAKKYALLGIDLVEVENEYNSIFEKDDEYRPAMPGSALIYPKEGWMNKFNSKKRYDLTYAEKKGFKVEIVSNIDEADIKVSGKLIEQIYELIKFAYQRHNSGFPIPSQLVFKKMFQNVNFILATVTQDDKCIALNLSIYNTNMTIVERVYAGAYEEALKNRIPSLIEVKMVEYLQNHNVKTYDLWGIRMGESDGVTNFKKSLGDETVYYPGCAVIKINPFMAFIIMNLMKVSRRFKS